MELPTATELHLEGLARTRRVCGWVVLLVGLPLCCLTFGHWLFASDPLAGAANGWIAALLALALPSGGAFGALVLVAAFALWRMVAWRERTLRRLGASPGAARPPVPWFALRAGPLVFAWWHIAALLFGGALTTIGMDWLEAAPYQGVAPAWFGFLPDAASAHGLASAELTWRVWIGAAHLVLGAACALVASWLGAVDGGRAPEARGVAAWLRLATWYCAISGGALLAAGLAPKFVADWPLDSVHAFFAGLTAVLWVEVALRAAAARWALFYSDREHPGASVWTDAVIPRLLGSTFNPSKSLFAVAADGFGIDLRGTYALEYMRRALLPIAATLCGVAWISTTLHAVPEWSVGVLERFGKRPSDGGVLEPGLHLLLPWPFDRVTQVDVHRVQSTPVGFERRIEGASLLWTKAHAEEEYRLVLGGGKELLSINGVLNWRPSDPIDFVYRVVDPGAALENIAGRVLVESTVGLSLADVLDADVEALTAVFERRIREEVASANLGIEIIGFVVLGLHPPLDVAKDYQSVVGAQIDAERLVIEAESYDETEVVRAIADANGRIADARGEAFSNVAESLGQIEAIARVAAARGTDESGSLELVLYLERLGVALRGLPYTVWDTRLEEDGATWWFLR